MKHTRQQVEVRRGEALDCLQYYYGAKELVSYEIIINLLRATHKELLCSGEEEEEVARVALLGFIKEVRCIVSLTFSQKTINMMRL